MECYHPLTAFQLMNGSVVFAERGDVFRTLSLPCGQCIGCRLLRARTWAIRCMHEAKTWERNCFVTLTYSDEYLPENGDLRYSDFQKFMKRLRRSLSMPVRFFACGEYGERFGRPHFHACLFNTDFVDKKYWRTTDAGSRSYRSSSLEALWPFGDCEVGDVTLESAGYVARYCVKKVTGRDADAHYSMINLETGELFKRTPEMAHMSLKPAIGALWLGRWFSDVYPAGKVLANGVKVKAPRYYDKLFQKLMPEEFELLQAKRYLEAQGRAAEHTQARLDVKEAVTLAATKALQRNKI